MHFDPRNHFSNSLMWGIANESGATDGKVGSAFLELFLPPPFPPFESFRFVPLGGMMQIFKVPGMNGDETMGIGGFPIYSEWWIGVAENDLSRSENLIL